MRKDWPVKSRTQYTAMAARENPNAHRLTREGCPWFGDEFELLIHAANRGSGDEGAAGDGSSWQMLCNVTNSRLGGVGKGEHGPTTSGGFGNTPRMRSHDLSCRKGIQYGVGRQFRSVPGEPGRYYMPAMGPRPVGLNIAVGDRDEAARGSGNFGDFHHEEWFAGAKDTRTQLRQWGTLWIIPERRKAVRP